MSTNFNVSVESELESIFNRRDTVGNLEGTHNSSNLSLPSFTNYVPTTENGKAVDEIDLLTTEAVDRCFAVRSPVLSTSSKSQFKAKLALRKAKRQSLSLVNVSGHSLGQSVDQELDSAAKKSNIKPLSQTDELFGKVFDFFAATPVLKDAALNGGKCAETVTVNVATEVNIISDIVIKPANKPANKSQSILQDLLAKPCNEPIPKRTSQIAKPTLKRSSQTMKSSFSLSLKRTDNDAFIAPIPSTSTAKPPKPCMIQPIPSTSTADPSTTFMQLSTIPPTSISPIGVDGILPLRIYGPDIYSAMDERTDKDLDDVNNKLRKFKSEAQHDLLHLRRSLKEYIGVHKLFGDNTNPGDSSRAVNLKRTIADLEVVLAAMK